MTVRAYLQSLFDQELVPTGCKTALLVGSLLFAINHGGACLRSEMNRERWISVGLSYLMPYLVSIYGQYSYRHKMHKMQTISTTWLANPPGEKLTVSQD